jgi:hypothetical protein
MSSNVTPIRPSGTLAAELPAAARRERSGRRSLARGRSKEVAEWKNNCRAICDGLRTLVTALEKRIKAPKGVRLRPEDVELARDSLRRSRLAIKWMRVEVLAAVKGAEAIDDERPAAPRLVVNNIPEGA